MAWFHILAVCSAVVSIGALSAAGQPVAPSVSVAASAAGLWLEPGAQTDIRPPGPPPKRPSAHRLDAPGPVTNHCLRVAYLIPTNRTIQAHAVASLRNALVLYQGWCREQMERHGFGPKTFRYETEADGVTPRIHVVQVKETDDYLRGDIWTRTVEAAMAAGVPVWTPKQVWWLLPETHVESANGAITGGVFLGAGFGSGDGGGVGMAGSDALARFRPEFLTNDAAYHNQLVAEIGPYALQQDVSFPWFERTTFSSIASSAMGGALHELAHGFGQPHDFRNDDNFHGNLLGNGLRGFRGALYPARYGADFTRLAYGAALGLNVSRFFNADTNFTDNTQPFLNISSSGATSPVNGLLPLNFNASDVGGLSAAWLIWKGDLVGEMSLSGSSISPTFWTAYYDPGQTNQYTISVFDRQGNKRNVDTAIVPQVGFNRAPRPFLKVTPPTAFVGQDVILDATLSSDPDGNAGDLLVEWDLNGDGTYEVAPSLSKLYTNRFMTAGNRLVRVRLTDTAGAKAGSTPIALAVQNLFLTANRVTNQVWLAWPATAAGFALESTPALASSNWQTMTQTAVIFGEQKVVAITNPVGEAFFRLRR